jgi:iron complex outermembrane receptor protein
MFVVLLALAGIRPAYSQTKDFDVPAQSATTGIPEFARQAGIQILVSEPLVRGKRVAAVTGSYLV